MKKISKEKLIKKLSIFIPLFLLSCLLYNNFLTGYFSIDTTKIIRLGYASYAINYSFYDGRIIMGIICLIAQSLKIRIKILYISMLVMALIISVMSVIKIIDIVKSKKEIKGKLANILVMMIAYCYIFNFMTIDNMQWIECFVIALSVWFYILSAEQLIIKHKIIKSILYCIIGVFCYQGTINMLIITSILFAMLENKTINKKMIKELAIMAEIALIATLLNVIFIKIFRLLCR